MLDLVNTVYETKKDVMNTVQRRANELNFAVSTKRSNGRSVYIQCIHGGLYRNTHNIQNNDRKRKKTTKKIGCKWLLSASIASKKKLWIIRSVSDINAHNHPLIDGVYQATSVCKSDEPDIISNTLSQNPFVTSEKQERNAKDYADCIKETNINHTNCTQDHPEHVEYSQIHIKNEDQMKDQLVVERHSVHQTNGISVE